MSSWGKETNELIAQGQYGHRHVVPKAQQGRGHHGPGLPRLGGRRLGGPAQCRHHGETQEHHDEQPAAPSADLPMTHHVPAVTSPGSTRTPKCVCKGRKRHNRHEEQRLYVGTGHSQCRNEPKYVIPDKIA